MLAGGLLTWQYDRVMESDRLMRAAASALDSLPAFDALRVVGVRASHRGSAVEIVNGAAAISITADWLEGDLTVAIRAVGGAPIELGALANSSDVKGLSLTRLPRSISVDSLARRLVQVLELLEREVPGVLAGADTAADALRGR